MSAKRLRRFVLVLVLAVWCWSEGLSAKAGLVAHWKLDEGSGEVFKDSVGGNDGFLPVNIPANVPFAADEVEIEWVTDDGPPGIQNTSVRFLGEASFIETTFEGIGENNPRTITAWVKAPPPSRATAMLTWGPASGAGRKWHFRINTGTNSLRTEYASGQNFAETDMADEEWHFVASVFPDGAELGSEILHYLDGEEDLFLGGNDQPINTLIGQPGQPWPQTIEDLDVWPAFIGFAPCCPDNQDRSFEGQLADIRVYDEALDPAALQVVMAGGGGGGVTLLQAGDADMDLDFDQLDLVQVQIAAKYLSGTAATWGEGDWDGAPGGQPGSPPAGNGFFDQLDIIAALASANYLTGPYAAIRSGGQVGDGQTSIIYDPGSGEVSVDAPAGTELTSINIDSAGGIFTGTAAANLGGSFDNDADNNIFKATFGGSFGSISFGNVAQAGLSADVVANDLTVVGSLFGGGDLGDVDLVYVPEPTSALLLSVGIVIGMLRFSRKNQ